MRPKPTLPYWLGGGTEECEICEHFYVLEMEYRCANCDRGICGQCAVIVHEAHIVLCYDCQKEDGEEAA